VWRAAAGKQRDCVIASYAVAHVPGNFCLRQRGTTFFWFSVFAQKPKTEEKKSTVLPQANSATAQVRYPAIAYVLVRP
jgi:hypothetical protein